ncbi:Hsp20/alpha crystallin family protein [bacterium]|nr:Hsp20/alpha crystallin family protein [bacterium]RQV98258.1 MAG: Hsp20/alpha crystallin family protein [bacterium]
MLVRLNPNRQLVSLPEEIDRFFNHWGFDFENSDSVWQPTVDIAESENNYELIAEIPGLSKNDIHIALEDGYLKLSGERKQEKETKNKNYHRTERVYGKFERSFRLPKEVNAEAIKADYKNGVLKIEIPKTEKAQPKQIAIS